MGNAATARPGSVNRSSPYRPADDDFETPIEAIRPFLEAVRLTPMVWESACGAGFMAEPLKEAGYEVVATTLQDRGYGETGIDFLATTELRAPTIMTNPPFSIIDKFVLHALSLEPEILAIFARTKFVEGGKRWRLIHDPHPFTAMYQFIERVTFFASDTPRSLQPGWNNEAFSWFVWNRRHSGREPVVRWLSTSHTPLFTEIG